MSIFSNILGAFGHGSKEKILVICGPTAVGKSDLAVAVALKFDGEVISADSRQVYRGLDIGSEKITSAEMRGVPHHMLDICDPSTRYTAAQFQTDGEAILRDIIARGKLPIVAGGSGLYIDAVLRRASFPNVKPNPKFRATLAKKSDKDLWNVLYHHDPERAENIDCTNRVRLIRALEIIDALGNIPKTQNSADKYQTLWVGLDMNDEELKQKIFYRLQKKLDNGSLVQETRDLIARGMSFERLNELGLEYKIVGEHIQKLINAEEMAEKLFYEIWHFAKRQRTWFQKNQEIYWFHPFLDRTEIMDTITKWI